MREIKFRGKCAHCDEWAYGNLADYGEGEIPEIQGFDPYGEEKEEWRNVPVDSDSVGQYTGLKDKNGKEIYEGDVVVRHSSICGSIDDIGVVKYDEEKAMFVLYRKNKLYETSFHFLKGQTINDGYCTFSETFTYEVIGNIYDNPELLKKN